MDFTLACDIMLDLEGSIRPAMYLANELTAKGYSVSMISPTMTDSVKEHLGFSRNNSNKPWSKTCH